MKRSSLTVAILFILTSPVSVLAEEQAISVETQAVLAEAQAVSAEVQAVLVEEPAVSDNTPVTVVSETEVSTPANPATSHQMHDMGMMHKGKGHGGMKHGGGKHGGGKGKGMHQKHEQVVKRLDMIEARMAKIEAMLEILIQR